MTAEYLVLFDLVCLGLQPDAELEFKGLRVADVDWNLVLDMAVRQGIGPIVGDGIQRGVERLNEASLPGRHDAPEASMLCALRGLDAPQFKAKRRRLAALSMQHEQLAEAQLKAVAALGDLWRRHGLQPYLLKGFTLAQYYPNPLHRISTDIDTYHLDGWEESNRVIEGEGIAVDRSYYKNSEFLFDGCTVENHRFCTMVRGWRHRKEFERYLRACVAEESPGQVLQTSMNATPAMLNVLFVLMHARQHFLLEGGIQLRHVCDWAMLLRAYAETLDWALFREQCVRFGLDRFAWPLTRVAHRVCGVPVPFECPREKEPVTRLIAEIMQPTCPVVDHSVKGWRVQLQIVRQLFRSRWKFRLYTHGSMEGYLLEMLWGYLFDRDPKID